MAEKIEVVIVSPMRRTLQTMFIGLEDVLERGVAVEVDAGWQGKSSSFCIFYLFSFCLVVRYVIYFSNSHCFFISEMSPVSIFSHVMLKPLYYSHHY
jgi:hypothetical protein